MKCKLISPFVLFSFENNDFVFIALNVSFKFDLNSPVFVLRDETQVFFNNLKRSFLYKWTITKN